MENNPIKAKKDPYDGEYIGNLWGWKTSLIGLAVILGLALLLFARYKQTGSWDFMHDEMQKSEINK